VTEMLSELGLPSFNALFNQYVTKFKVQWLMASNDAIGHFISTFYS